MSSKAASRTLVVEFIGVTGVGKTTLIAASIEFLSARGVRVCLAEEAILSRYGLLLRGHPKFRSALNLLLGLPSFGRHCFRPEGRRLLRLALGSIGRGMGNLWMGGSLLRNFVKRVGCHFLLESLRTSMRQHEILIWDEGVVHSAHNLFVHAGAAPRRADIEEFGRLVPKPDLLVWVTAPTQQSAEVVLERGHRRVRATRSAARNFAENAQTTFEVLARVPELCERIYRVDNSVDPRKNGAAIRDRARDIAEFLIRQLHRPAALPPGASAPAPLALTTGQAS